MHKHTTNAGLQCDVCISFPHSHCAHGSPVHWDHRPQADGPVSHSCCKKTCFSGPSLPSLVLEKKGSEEDKPELLNWIPV